MPLFVVDYEKKAHLKSSLSKLQQISWGIIGEKS